MREHPYCSDEACPDTHCIEWREAKKRRAIPDLSPSDEAVVIRSLCAERQCGLVEGIGRRAILKMQKLNRRLLEVEVTGHEFTQMLHDMRMPNRTTDDTLQLATPCGVVTVRRGAA